MEVDILTLLQQRSLSKGEIAKNLGHRTVSGGLKKVIQGLLSKGAIEYTLPEKPNSRHQKYKVRSSDLREKLLKKET